MFRRYCLPWLVLGLYRLWSATWRITIVEPSAQSRARDAGGAFIFAHWHRDELAIVHLVRRYRIATMTSTSKDGQLIDFVIRRLGGATAKGSSSKGGAGALRCMIRLVRGGHCASFAVDGPRGPIFKAKPGVFELSKLTQVAIVPVGIASQRRFIFRKSWNQARLPLPFSRVVVWFDEPLLLADFPDSGMKCPQLAAALEEKLTAACARAEAQGRALTGSKPHANDGFSALPGDVSPTPLG